MKGFCCHFLYSLGFSQKTEDISMELNPIAFRKAKIAYNFSLYECNRVNKFSKTKSV